MRKTINSRFFHLTNVQLKNIDMFPVICTFYIDLSYFYRTISHSSYSTPMKIRIEILNFKCYICIVMSKICLIYKTYFSYL